MNTNENMKEYFNNTILKMLPLNEDKTTPLECIDIKEEPTEINVNYAEIQLEPVNLIDDIKQEPQDVAMTNLDDIKTEETIVSCYIYCYTCQQDFEDYCPHCSNITHILNSTERGLKDRVNNTLPKGIVEIGQTRYGKFGIFALKIIPNNVNFGPYDNLKMISKLTGNLWEIENGKFRNIDICNWMSYVNSTKNIKEKNLAIICNGDDLYFRSERQIEKGEELLIYFDNDFIVTVISKIYYQPIAMDNIEVIYACEPCCLGFSVKQDLLQHVARCPYNTIKGNQSNVTECPCCKIYFLSNYIEIHNRNCWKYHKRKTKGLIEDTNIIKLNNDYQEIPNNYLCHFCPFVCLHDEQLKKHLQIHAVHPNYMAPNEMYLCHECSFVCAYDEEFLHHTQFHANRPNYYLSTAVENENTVAWEIDNCYEDDPSESKELILGISEEIKNIEENSDNTDSRTDTNTQPSTSHDFSEKIKYRRGHSLTLNEKYKILNMYSSLKKSNQKLTVTALVNAVSLQGAVCHGTVYRILREFKTNKMLLPSRAGKNKKNLSSKLEESQLAAIRRKIIDSMVNEKTPALHYILSLVNDDDTLPSFSRTSFYSLMKQLHFQCVHVGQKYRFIDKDNLRKSRRKYLRKIRKFRLEKRRIYYLSEMCVNQNNLAKKKPKSKLRMDVRLAIVGSETGLAHQEYVCINKFEDYFGKIIESLEANCVIVMDSAEHHCKCIEAMPEGNWDKLRIQMWLRTKNIDYEEDSVSAELLVLAKSHKAKYEKYIIDEIAESTGKTILRIPPYHPELSPIELIWTEVQKILTEQTTPVDNTSDTTKNDLGSVTRILSLIPVKKWQESVQIVIEEVEKKFWNLDVIMDDVIERML